MTRINPFVNSCAFEYWCRCNMEIIPAILEPTWQEIEKKIKLVDGLTDWIQLDICDGEFAEGKTWGNPQDLFSLQVKSKIEAHLMIKEPWLWADEWLSSPAKRIVAHVEAFSSPESLKFGEIAFTAQKYGKEVVWGFNIETDWEPYKELMQKPHVWVLFLSVVPGRQGQEFDRRVFEKIASLKEKHPHVKICLDGGINPGLIDEIEKSGADSVAVGSYILESSDPAEAIDEFKKV